MSDIDRWHACSQERPPENELVETKISDSDGERNVTTLQRIGNLFFVPDGSMYVYYEPTHWRRIPG